MLAASPINHGVPMQFVYVLTTVVNGVCWRQNLHFSGTVWGTVIKCFRVKSVLRITYFAPVGSFWREPVGRGRRRPRSGSASRRKTRGCGSASCSFAAPFQKRGGEWYLTAELQGVEIYERKVSAEIKEPGVAGLKKGEGIHSAQLMGGFFRT